MEEYKSNSHRLREGINEPAEEKKKVEKVVNGSAKTKKKTLVQKFAEAFVPEDVSNVKEYIFEDLMIPAAKKLIDDIVSNGVSMLLWGGKGRSNSGSKASRINYNSLHDNRGSSVARTRSRYDYDDVILDTRRDADDVLERMREIVREYGMVSVADLYDLVGITGNYTDNKYGWTDIRNAYVEHVRDGYLIRMPRIVPLN